MAKADRDETPEQRRLRKQRANDGGSAKGEKSTIRLSAEDHANIAKIVQSGAASNISEAIRVALASYADGFAVVKQLKAIERRLERLETGSVLRV